MTECFQSSPSHELIPTSHFRPWGSLKPPATSINILKAGCAGKQNLAGENHVFQKLYLKTRFSVEHQLNRGCQSRVNCRTQKLAIGVGMVYRAAMYRNGDKFFPNPEEVGRDLPPLTAPSPPRDPQRFLCCPYQQGIMEVIEL